MMTYWRHVPFKIQHPLLRVSQIKVRLHDVLEGLWLMSLTFHALGVQLKDNYRC